MKLEMKNIGRINSANISMEGLTVIAGGNDMGKSTIGKMLFSLVKGIASAQKAHFLNSYEGVEKYIISIRKRFGKKIRPFQLFLPDLNIGSFEEIQKKFLHSEITFDDFESTIKRAINVYGLTPQISKLVSNDLAGIKAILNSKDNPSARLFANIQNVIETEFINNICTFDTRESFVSFTGMDEDERISITLQNNQVKESSWSKPFDIEDVTYIESPLYLHLLQALSYCSLYREDEYSGGFAINRMLPLHIKDLVDKIQLMRFGIKSDTYTQIQEIIGKIIKGRFVFDKDKRTVLFNRGNQRVSSITAASGIKTFGLLQILIDTLSINEKRMLIWDEPENHLHPEWQVKFAEMLTLLAKEGIQIVVSSHSPYFIQSIRYFSSKNKIVPFTKFYFCDENENGVCTQDVSDDLNNVFQRLATPLNQVLNID